MGTLLLRHADYLVTMDPDPQKRVIRDGGIFVRDNVIEQVGPTETLPAEADRIINARGMIVLPGLVNTHHHLYQTLTRAIPEAQNVNLFQWLKTLYPIWAELTGEAAYVSALIGMAELILSGCTTTSDHLYLFPNDVKLDHTIYAAREIGIRFHASRGSMSLGESKGGLPPDRVVEDEETILKDTQRVIETFHDPKRYAMVRIVVAPCSPFSVSPDLMRESIALARAYNVHAHTHLAETLDEERYCLERYGKRPVEYAEELGWVGEDVWYAHGIHVNDQEIALLARTGTGVAHCPSSNMRLASGIAPVKKYLRAGVRVGLGVDGSASNDSSHMLAEVRQAMLLQRVQGDPAGLTAWQALEIATVGGARVLGRDDIGRLAPQMAADFIGFKLERLEYAGALHDPIAALVFCTPQHVDLSVINGKVIVENGQFTHFDPEPIIRRHNALARQMVERARARK